MINKIGFWMTGVVFVCMSNLAVAEPGNLFSIREQCIVPNPFPVILCLYGPGKVTCEDYTVHGTDLFIKTTVPHHTYAYAGIKVLSPLYIPLNCTHYDNGFCLFSVNDSTPTFITMQPLVGFKTIC